MDEKDKINDFFVSCFYSVLNAEERALEAISNGKLSLKEIHVIEAVFKAREAKENNFSAIARRVGVTLGTLTAAFNKLEKKGYLRKERDTADKRVYYIEPTRLAELVNEEHSAFHRKMVDGIAAALPPEKLKDLTDSLRVVGDFFSRL